MEKSRHPLPEPVTETVTETETKEVEEVSPAEGEMVISGETFEITTHTVRKGDTLWSLSERYLGEGGRWKELYETNRETLSDPDQLLVGIELRIPQQ